MDGEAGGVEFVDEFGVDEVDLAEVGRGGVFAHAAAVLDGDAEVGVAFYAQGGEEADACMG